MFRSISTLLSLSVFLWILPLGAFIKPSQEETACGGNRGFHMCSMTEDSSVKKNTKSGEISFTSASGAEKNNKSASGSGGDDFINSSAVINVQEKPSKFDELDLVFPRQLFFPVPFPIPKA